MSDLRREALRHAMPWLVLAGLLIVWEVCCIVFQVPEIILPKPTKIFAVFVQRFDILMAYCWDTLWTTTIGFLLAIAGGAWIGNIFLRRIDTITRTSRTIMEGDLSARIPTRGTHDEIDQLVASLNAMLARIQQLMDGLRQVSSDIAHDLRTPLGRLRQRSSGPMPAVGSSSSSTLGSSARARPISSSFWSP